MKMCKTLYDMVKITLLPNYFVPLIADVCREE